MLLVKSTLLKSMRDNLNQDLTTIQRSAKKVSEKTIKLNILIREYKDKLVEYQNASQNSNEDKLKNILLINYVAYVFGLESRNRIWNYDYMAFSRRIGEMWEPFCKIPFQYPLNNIKEVEPKEFSEIKSKMCMDYENFLNSLNLEKHNKEQLLMYLNELWNFVDSGAINLSLDKHIKYDNKYINIDFKSGFNSNEKGNTNRLLTVGSIYGRIYQNNENIILVRAERDENNHYLKILNGSRIWTVFCGEETYQKIFEFTGFNLKNWINENIKWDEDLDCEFYEYLVKNDLNKYLRW